jgi:DNA polymerase-3 subunit delta'
MWEVIGQEGAVSLLQHSLALGRLSHAYLFVGPMHVGKMTLAINLAQALNCQSNDKPCLECDSCKKIGENKHSDVQVINLDYNEEEDAERKLIGVEQIDGILHDASLPPFEGNYKVFIIEKAELLSIGAANRLLKTLEEPEAKVVFILLATNEKRLLKTVVSRCQRIELKPMPLAQEAKVLTEKFGVNAEQSNLLAGLSHGCLGWAITAASDAQILTRRQEALDEIVNTIKGNGEGRFAYAARLAADFTKNRQAVYDVLDIWLDLWRDVLLVKLDSTTMITNIDRQEALIKMAANYKLRQIRNCVKSIESAGEQLKQNVNPRLALEVLMLDLPRLEVKASPVV